MSFNREDPRNEYGGSYNFKINKHHSVLTWRDILVLLIGENMHWIKNNVLGVSVSCRQHVDNYQIWTAHNNSKINDNLVKTTLTDLLYPADIQSFYFKSTVVIIANSLVTNLNFCFISA